MTTLARTYPYVGLAVEYAHDVVTEKIPACRWVKLACERQLRDLDAYKGKDDPFYFDWAAGDRVCKIVSLFPHTKGIWAQARKKIELEPWQCFILTTVFGWMCTASGTRRYRVVYIEVPRKNAKSTLTSALGNYLVACDGEAGAYVVSAANTLKQAKLVFNDAQLMARREPGFLSKFGVQVLAHVIVQEHTASKFEALAAEYSNLDGLNIHAALIDELHAHPTRGLWDVLETATGSRSQSLLWAITTAGLDRGSVCYDQRRHTIDILNGVVADEAYFGIIYTRDDGDDPWEESTWRKCNPNYGISIYPETLRTEAARAQVIAAQQNAFFMKHLNIWVNADSAWLPAGAWEKCTNLHLDISDLEHQPCIIGVDLALRSDIADIVAAFPPTDGRDYWAVFAYHFLPEQTIMRGENAHYQGWESDGLLTSVPGAILDFDYLLERLDDLCSRFQCMEIAIDPYHAGALIAAIEKRGLPRPVEIRQSAPNMSPAMVECEALVLSQRIRHDGDPVLAWMVSNTTAHRNGDLLQPRKEDEAKKIDGVTSLLMCLHRALKLGLTAGGESEVRGLWSI
jgi:phage terminase large subunit-like protein